MADFDGLLSSAGLITSALGLATHPPSHFLTCGRKPTKFAPRARSTSSVLLRVIFIESTARATPMLSMSDRINANSILRGIFGYTGDRDGCAGSAIRIVLFWKPELMLDSLILFASS